MNRHLFAMTFSLGVLAFIALVTWEPGVLLFGLLGAIVAVAYRLAYDSRR